MCINALAMIAGYSPDNLDPSRLPVYLSHSPSGTSVANMAHWCQAVRGPPASRSDSSGGSGGGGSGGSGSGGGGGLGGGGGSGDGERERARMLYFDFGTRCATVLGAPRMCNQRAYDGARSPPEYNLSAVAAPLALFTGGRDALADPQDAALLAARLGAKWVVARRHEADYAVRAGAREGEGERGRKGREGGSRRDAREQATPIRN